jgi:CheY-like chemotaxis protein
MGYPQPSDGQPPESGPVVRVGQEAPTENKPPRGRHDASSADAASDLANDLKKPLAVVIANLQLLADLVTSVRAEAATEGGVRPDAGEWLTIRMAEADNCLSDAHAGTDRIREIVAPKKALRQQASDRTPLRGEVRPARILIVDDEAGLGRALQRIFRGYDTVFNTGAQGALDRIVIGERFDLILSDVGMPGMSGCDLYDEIRRLDPEQASRTVFLTGGSDEQKALAATGQPVLTKPFDIKDLRAFVEKFLGWPTRGLAVAVL